MKYILLTILFLSQILYASQERYSKDVLEKKIYPMGKKIYEKRCKQNIDISKYSSFDSLESDLKEKELCGTLKDKHLEALVYYLWDVKNLKSEEGTQLKIVLKDREKCPVCGMFIYKYPKWAAQIYYKHDSHEDHFSFDGVKDMMKFYFSPMEWGDYGEFKQENITKILVTDYYSQKVIDGIKAFYVIGSDVYGPMGNELIPFKDLEDAETFKMDHQGKKIIKFSDIVEDEVYELDN